MAKITFKFRDNNGKLHTRTAKCTSCKYAWETQYGVRRFVVRDYFTNAVVSKFDTKNWSFVSAEVEA